MLEWLPALRNTLQAHVVIVNAENAAGGIGLTPDLANTLLRQAHVDVLTLGNHAWGKREIYSYLDTEPRIVRPANYPPGAPGRGFGFYRTTEGLLAVIALQGRTFMEPVDDPFRVIDELLNEIQPKTHFIFVDFHAEATSEKQALGWYVDGRVSAVIGTHTHVQTADERILPGGSAYLTDVGMTGPTDSVIGMDRHVIIQRFLSGLPSRFEVAEGQAHLSAVLVDLDSSTGHAVRILRLQIASEADIIPLAQSLP